MSGPYDPGYGMGAPVGTVGAPTGFLDNFEATLHIASQNDDYLAGEREIRQAWDNSVRQLEQRNGTRFAEADPLPIIEDQLDPNNERTLTRAFLGVNDTSATRTASFAEAQKINDQLNQLNDPNAPSIEKIVQQVTQARAARSADAQNIEDRGAFGTALAGRFAGGLVGTLADPAQLPTLLVGGFGKTVAVKIASEVATNAAASAAIQGELINPQAKAFGEQQGSILQAALIGGALGGVFGGAREGLGILASRALDRATPNIGPLDFKDEQLASMFAQPSDNPSIRAGQEALGEQAHYDASRSYPDTEAGNQRFTGEATDIYDSLTGSQRVLAQVLPPVEDFTFDNLDYHTQVVREQTPEVYDRLEQATARVNDLDSQIADTQQKLDGLSVGDALAQIDQNTGDLVREYEQQLAQPNLSNVDRAALEQKIQGIVESVQATPTDLAPQIQAAEARVAEAGTKQEALAAARDLDKLYKSAGEDTLQKAMNSVEVPLKKSLQALRASRKAAAKEFRFARNDMDQRIKQVQLEEKLRESLRPQQGTATEHGPIDVEALRSDRVEEARAAVDEAAAKAPQEGEALGQRILDTTKEVEPAADGTLPEPPPNAMVDPEGNIDFDGLKLPPDFLVSDGLGNDIKVGDVFKAMQEDEKLVEAMRICSL